MKTFNKLPIADCRLPIENREAYFASIVNRKSQIVNRLGFTLIELLTVIAIIGVLAGMIFAIAGPAKKMQYLKTARAEMTQIETALDNYKAKYGVYPPGNSQPVGFYAVGTNSMYPQLYYELLGVTKNNVDYVTLDSVGSIPIASVNSAFGVTGFINCSRSGDEESVRAQNFLLGLRDNRIASITNAAGVGYKILITSVRGPDAAYKPLGPGLPDINPFRYVYPGINNPNSYDLWVQLVISGKTNLICNWSKQVIVGSPLP